MPLAYPADTIRWASVVDDGPTLAHRLVFARWTEPGSGLSWIYSCMSWLTFYLRNLMAIVIRVFFLWQEGLPQMGWTDNLPLCLSYTAVQIQNAVSAYLYSTFWLCTAVYPYIVYIFWFRHKRSRETLHFVATNWQYEKLLEGLSYSRQHPLLHTNTVRWKAFLRFKKALLTLKE